MDANHLLTWLVAGSSLALGLSAWRRRRHGVASWVWISALVLAVLGVAWLVAPAIAGFVGAAVFTPLIALPALLFRTSISLFQKRRYGAAARIGRLAALLHPFGNIRNVPGRIRALHCYQIGDAATGRALLEARIARGGREGDRARSLLLRAEHRWEDLAAEFLGSPRADALLSDGAIFTQVVRALGELGRTSELLALWRARRHTGAASQAMTRMFVLAFGGRPHDVERIFDTAMTGFDDEIRTFWVATAWQAAGDLALARELLEPLASTSTDHQLRAFARDRLDAPLTPLAQQVPAPGPAEHQTLRDVAREARREDGAPTLSRPPRGIPWMTTALSAVLIVVYLFEVPGGTESASNLHRMGAMVAPAERLDGQYWRLLTSGFLHAGALHLLMNLIGLWFFGRFLEHALGRWRFALVYVGAGVGAMASFLLLATATGQPAQMVVGASASVMGVLGATGVVLLRRLRVLKARRLRVELSSLVLLVVIQTVFDLLTPRISFVGHAAGATIGVLLGLAVVRRGDDAAEPVAER